MFLRGQAGAEAVMTIRTSVLVRNRAGEVSLERARQPPFEQRTHARCNCRGGGTLQRAPHRPSPRVAEHSRATCADGRRHLRHIKRADAAGHPAHGQRRPRWCHSVLGVGTTAQYLLPRRRATGVRGQGEIWRQAEADDPEPCAECTQTSTLAKGSGSATCPLARRANRAWRKDPSLLGEECTCCLARTTKPCPRRAASACSAATAPMHASRREGAGLARRASSAPRRRRCRGCAKGPYLSAGHAAAAVRSGRLATRSA